MDRVIVSDYPKYLYIISIKDDYPAVTAIKFKIAGGERKKRNSNLYDINHILLNIPKVPRITNSSYDFLSFFKSFFPKSVITFPLKLQFRRRSKKLRRAKITS